MKTTEIVNSRVEKIYFGLDRDNGILVLRIFLIVE